MDTVKVTIVYGTKRVEFDAPAGTTPAQILQDNFLKAALGYGDNVRIVRDGADVSSVPLQRSPDPIELRVETKANSKA